MIGPETLHKKFRVGLLHGLREHLLRRQTFTLADQDKGQGNSCHFFTGFYSLPELSPQYVPFPGITELRLHTLMPTAFHEKTVQLVKEMMPRKFIDLLLTDNQHILLTSNEKTRMIKTFSNQHLPKINVRKCCNRKFGGWQQNCCCIYLKTCRYYSFFFDRLAGVGENTSVLQIPSALQILVSQSSLVNR